MKSESQLSTAKGFTRVELLAVVSVVTILMAMALPGLAQSRDKARRVRCIDNLKGIGIAIRSFANDHDHRFPMAVRGTEGGSADYLGFSASSNPDQLWRHYWVLSNELVNPMVLLCPADPARYLPTSWNDMTGNKARNASISYGIGTGAQPGSPRMILAADRSLEWPSGSVQFRYNDSSRRGDVGTNQIQLQSLGWHPRGMHQAAGNAALADGSARLLTTPGVQDAFANSGNARNNYGQPGRSSN